MEEMRLKWIALRQQSMGSGLWERLKRVMQSVDAIRVVEVDEGIRGDGGTGEKWNRGIGKRGSEGSWPPPPLPPPPGLLPVI